MSGRRRPGIRLRGGKGRLVPRGCLRGYAGCRHPHHLIGNAIRLMLQRIIDGADFEFRLNGRPGEARCRKLGRRLEFAAHPLGRKGRYLTEIPSKAARSSFGTHAFRADVLPGIAVLVLDETLSPEKPEHRLVSDRPLTHTQVFGAAIVKTMAKRCSAVKRRCVPRRCGGLRLWLCNWRSKHSRLHSRADAMKVA